MPRTSFGGVLTWLLLILWYALYAAVAFGLAWKLPDFLIGELAAWLPSGLLGVFLFWQVIPLLTLSSGWSLQVNKLQVYPVANRALFGLETLLRITSAPEMVIVLLGTTVGLFRHPAVPSLAPLAMLLFIPFNLFFQLAVRDLILHSFERNRFRELFALLVISIGILPQLLLRTGLGHRLKPYYFAVARNGIAPWSEIASLSLGRVHFFDVVLALAWIALSFAVARWAFGKSLVADDSFHASSSTTAPAKTGTSFRFWSWPERIFTDPLAVLMQKEFQSLVRMPKFRVLFGMSCVLGMLVFVPAALNGNDPTSAFMRNNLIPVVNVYGLLLLSDTLLLNAFGLDRGAAQVYFVTPVELGDVLKAKNLTAITFVLIQSAAILLVAVVAHAPVTLLGVTSGLIASAVVCVFLLATGNLTSLTMPRPIDPKQTFKKQGGAAMQIWILGCVLGLSVLVGFAYLARYALQSDWAFLITLGFEFLIGAVVYRVSLESAVRRGHRNREMIVQSLSKNASPMSLG
ncbi:MAG: hypothetical protein M3Y24_12980 [Acidobacteriota bacterium]|nr:hypothetical protein [Acidobacteriota bacterium]